MPTKPAAIKEDPRRIPRRKNPENIKVNPWRLIASPLLNKRNIWIVDSASTVINKAISLVTVQTKENLSMIVVVLLRTITIIRRTMNIVVMKIAIRNDKTLARSPRKRLPNLYEA
jgi:hypothetical protein